MIAKDLIFVCLFFLSLTVHLVVVLFPPAFKANSLLECTKQVKYSGVDFNILCPNLKSISPTKKDIDILNHNKTFKSNLLSEFIDKQIDYNQAAENMIEKQNKKIRNQKEEIDKITGNCENMEFLIRKLGLEEKIKELGIKPSSNYMNEEEFEQFRNKMNNQNMNLNGENKFP